MEKIALSHPEISISFKSNGKVRVHTSGNGSLKDVIYSIYGKEITENIIEINEHNDFMTITGYIGKAIVSKGNRTFENYFINGRYIKSNIISKAIEDGYKFILMQHKYPFTVLNFEINPEFLDVNVHPSKMELRFRKSEKIYPMISECINDTLIEKPNIIDVKLEKESEKRANIKYMPEPFETKRQHILGDTDDSDHVVREETIYNKPSVTPSVMKETNKYNVQNLPEVSQNDTLKTDEKVSAPLQQEVTDVYENFLSDIAKPKHNIIGQVFDTYWIVQYNEKMYIIDQHAAHEKVMFESLMEKRKTGQIHTQMISPPIILNLSMNEADLIQRYLQNFKEIGFEIEPFGGQDFAVRGVPTDLYTLDSQEVLMEIIDNLSNESAKMSPDILTDKIASMSCKAAVKGNNRMSFREADELITQLLSLENPYNCPHGRPTIISMSKYELEKKFKRII